MIGWKILLRYVHVIFSELANVILYGRWDFAEGNKLTIVPSRDSLRLTGWVQCHCNSCHKRVTGKARGSGEGNMMWDTEAGVMSFEDERKGYRTIHTRNISHHLKLKRQRNICIFFKFANLIFFFLSFFLFLWPHLTAGGTSLTKDWTCVPCSPPKCFLTTRGAIVLFEDTEVMDICYSSNRKLMKTFCYKLQLIEQWQFSFESE